MNYLKTDSIKKKYTFMNRKVSNILLNNYGTQKNVDLDN